VATPRASSLHQLQVLVVSPPTQHPAVPYCCSLSLSLSYTPHVGEQPRWNTPKQDTTVAWRGVASYLSEVRIIVGEIVNLLDDGVVAERLELVGRQTIRCRRPGRDPAPAEHATERYPSQEHEFAPRSHQPLPLKMDSLAFAPLVSPFLSLLSLPSSLAYLEARFTPVPIAPLWLVQNP